MKIKKIFPMVSLLSASLLYAGGGFAINKNIQIADSNDQIMSDADYKKSLAEQENLIKNYGAAETFIQDGVKYSYYPNLKISFNKKESHEDKEIKKVLTTQSFKIYEVNTQMQSQGNNTSLQKKPAVIYNTSSKKFAAFSGKIIVQMKEGKTFSDSNFVISKSYPQMNYVILNKPENKTIGESINSLKANRDIDKVIVEILENLQEPM
ncbi:hypothetical protein [Fluviispira sanaruensis]|uniref:Uncharacterized protein n=1 Tax=Fluviispira sanaruensis TaxID=2493639 RepID=A0A4P2VQU0_FLUSA|nr:hypothetical protein [Fluviispira sanaruensis]BBH54479.1 hypothetical protein JCM31447_29500 [Fluviispira sanaruensis]